MIERSGGARFQKKSSEYLMGVKGRKLGQSRRHIWNSPGPELFSSLAPPPDVFRFKSSNGQCLVLQNYDISYLLV